MPNPQATDLARELANWIDPPPHPLLAYWSDPVGFVHDCFAWETGKGPTPYQNNTLAALAEHHRVCVRGPHGLGKTAEKAWAVLWFALTRDAAGIDWKVPTTASWWRQLTKFLWPEIDRWAKRIRWDVIGRDPFTRFELQKQALKLTYGEAFAVASDNAAAIEGAHATQMFYVFDEAKEIEATTFDAAEGAFSNAGTEPDADAFALASSTPGAPQGRFYDIQTRKPGYEDWYAIHVTLEEAIAARRISREWADQRAKQFGRNSAQYQNRVLGNFHAQDEEAVIKLAWVEAANERWHAIFDDVADGVTPMLANFTAVGVDVSEDGGDRTVLALRHGYVITELREQPIADVMATTGVTAGILRANRGYAVVDAVGIGSGVVKRLWELDLECIAFSAGKRCDLVAQDGELGFADCRAAAWWNLRELLDPAFGSKVALPPDDRLTGDLTAPHWQVMSGGKIRVESKKDIRKRIGRSTDDGDAVVQAFWTEPAVIDEVFEYEDGEYGISKY